MPRQSQSITTRGDRLVIEQDLFGVLEAIKKGQAEGFATLTQAMSGKADKADLARIEGVLDQHAQRLSHLEQIEHDRTVRAGVHTARDERVRLTRKQAAAAIAGSLTLLATLTLAIVAVLHL